MNLVIAPNGVLQIEDARITFRNFAGVGTVYNREGDRNFSLIIEDQETADMLTSLGWNVKIRPPREVGEDSFVHLPVKIKFNEFGPRVVLITNGIMNELDEETVACLDNIRISHIDMDVRPYDWVVQEGTPREARGRAAYLQAIYVTQAQSNDWLTDKYNEMYGG